MDVIKINVPTFVRILELAREEIKNDPDLHDIAEIAVRLSQEGVIGMDDYDAIVNYMKKQGNDDAEPEENDTELDDIKRLSGMN